MGISHACSGEILSGGVAAVVGTEYAYTRCKDINGRAVVGELSAIVGTLDYTHSNGGWAEAGE
jgi:hypothetical protein